MSCFPALVSFSFLLISWTSSLLYSQNLAPNPDFEYFTECPGSYSDLYCAPWINGNSGTSDYWDTCATGAAGVPNNEEGWQDAHSGGGYVGVIFKHYESGVREYITAPLLQLLEQGFTYEISFWVNLPSAKCGVSEFGAYFSTAPPPDPGPWELLEVEPQFKPVVGFISDTLNWVEISGCFIADDNHGWVTIGNFSDDAHTPVDPNCIAMVNKSYYYIDDVSVVKSGLPSQLEFDLGPPVVACDSFLISPGLPNSHYLWEDGSTDSTLTVTESGSYYVTITHECEIGVDFIDVTIEEVYEVDVGPSEINICDGETYLISLDPELGNYLWSDGSTSVIYEITTPGIYQVTLDDGCQLSTDAVLVNVITSPSPFSLGNDTVLCEGEIIEINFDPSLGDFLWQDNSSSPWISISEGGMYSLTISNACGEFSDTIEVSLQTLPEFELGPPELSLCNGESFEIAIDPSIGFIEWQDGDTSFNYLIVQSGTYQATVTNNCGSISESIEVFYLAPPIVDLGEDLVLCPFELPYLLNVSQNTDVTYLWQDGSTSPQFNVIAAGFYDVTLENMCGIATDMVYISISNNLPDINLPQDQILCQGQTFLLDASSASGNYIWQDSTTASTFNVNTSGTYSVTVSTSCGSDADTIVVDYIEDVTSPDLGPDIDLCPGESLTLHGPGGNVNYMWHNQSVADSLVINSAGVYWLQISNMCSAAADTIVVNISDNPPEVDLPSSVTVCSGQTSVIDAGIAGVEYLWSNGSQLSSIDVTIAGMYSLTVSNSCGTAADTVFVVDGGPAPIVSLPENLSLCLGETILLAPVSSDVISWLWQNGSTASSYNVTSEGLIFVEVSNDCGVAFDSTIVTLLPTIPILDLGGDTSLCPGELLTLSITIPDVGIEWSDGTTGNSLDVHDEGLVYATISNQCGSSIDSLNISLLPAPPVLDLGTDQSLCPGETISLSPGIANVDYLWQDGSTTATYQTTLPGTIILTVSNECGMSTDTLLVFEDTNGPDVDLGEDILACEGEIVTINAGISGVDYLWQDGSTSSQLTTHTSGTFILHVSNACGEDVDTISVEINGVVPTPDLGPDTILCEGFTLQLISDANAATSIEWQDGSTIPAFIVSSPGMYILSESNHCGDAADTINIAYTAAPQPFALVSDTILCPGSFLVLSAPQTNDLITWQDGSHGISMIVDQEQTYSLQISNVCGKFIDALEVSFDDRVPVINIDPVIEICQGEIITLDATQSFEAGYLWNTGSTNSSLQVNTSGIYAVNVTTLCESIHQNIEVMIGKECHDDIYIPSVFSPNGDHINDEWIISTGAGLDIISVQCNIFDRWGNMVFDTKENPVSWSGINNGKIFMPGVYTFVLKINYWERNIEQSLVKYGDVTLIR